MLRFDDYKAKMFFVLSFDRTEFCDTRENVIRMVLVILILLRNEFAFNVSLKAYISWELLRF